MSERARPATGSLFDEDAGRPPAVQPAAPDAAVAQLASALPAHLRLGTSSWHFPGWAGLVWDRMYREAQLSREGLGAYAQHPLFRTVSLDRGFYRPLPAAVYARYAAQVPASFRFVVKAPARVTDALIRDPGGRGRQANPEFLDARVAWRDFLAPALDGLGETLGALVFQISPLPAHRLRSMAPLFDALHGFLKRVVDIRGQAPGVVTAVEVRNAEWLAPAFVAALKDTGATYCLGLHARMPSIEAQLPVLRALWPGPLVCRWNLNPAHGAYGYQRARGGYAPFDRIVDPDPDTRAALARVIAGTVGAGQPAYVTINNKAEGSAPRSVAALADAVRTEARNRGG